MNKNRSLLLLSILISSCGANYQNSSLENESVQIGTLSSRNSSNKASEYQSWDDKLASIAKKYPAFGGYYEDEESGEYFILIANNYKGTAINEESASENGRKLGLIKGELEKFLVDNKAVTLEEAKGIKFKFKKVEQSFAALQEWRILLRENLDDDISMLKIDDKNNKLVIGYSEFSANNGSNNISTVTMQSNGRGSRVRALLNSSNIPESVTTLIDYTPRSTAAVTKNLFNGTNFSPPMAGERWDTSSSSLGGCTIGANVTYGGVSGFLTASHCTKAVGPDPLPEQEAFMGTTKIGVESYDPNAYFGCFNQNTQWKNDCRYADVVFMKYTVPSNRGRIVKTTEGARLTTTVQSDTITGDPYYKVSSVDWARPPVNRYLENVGYVGGWKKARVTDNDTDITYLTDTGGQDFTLLNSVEVVAVSNTTDPREQVAVCKGDSGGPWYRKGATTDGSLIFQGIQSGGGGEVVYIQNGQNCYKTAYLSAMDQVARSFPKEMLMDSQ